MTTEHTISSSSPTPVEDPFKDTDDSSKPANPEPAHPATNTEPANPATNSSPGNPVSPVSSANPVTQTAEEHPADSRLGVLKAMFPDFDDSLLQSVLQSVGGNQDRAIDMLLGMSDPEYKSDVRPEQPEERELSQTELDEQFARQLYMQEQDEDNQYRQSQWEAQQQAQQSRPAPGEDKDVMSEVSEQFKYIAETGKKTFGNIMSKVRAKISEFDQQRQPGQSSSNSNIHGGYNPSPPNDTYNPDPISQQPAFYDPNAHSQSNHTSPTSHTPPTGALSNHAQGYDVSTPSNDVSSSSSSAPPPPITNTGTGTKAGLDGGKLGLLPKRPVSLVAQSPPTRKPDDDDDLEYVENPFEESGKK